MAQFRKLLSENQRQSRFQWKFVLRIFLTCFFLIILWLTLKKQEQSLADVWQQTTLRLMQGEGIWLAGLLLLVPVNWTLESFKWQLLVNKVQKISFGEALTSTLAGLLSGLALPAQVGDVVGRVAALNISKKSKTVGAALISGGIQFYASVFVGLWAIFFLWDRLGIHQMALFVLVSLLCCIVLFGILIFTFRERLFSGVSSNRFLKKVRTSLEVISEYTNGELLKAFGVGMLRYATYLAQFVAGLLLFSFDLSFLEMVSCVALVLMIKTIMPAMNLLGDLGLRGVSAVFVFGKFGVLPEDVIAVTLLIWMTNILFPALFGLFLIWVRSWRIL